jgi:hypothetical protein
MKNNNSGIKKPSLRDGSKNNVQRHHSKIHLSPTQSRAVKLLLKGSFLSWDLERLIHCRYAPDIIQHVRAKGIHIQPFPLKTNILV